MTNLCPELATKAELAALEYQIDQKLNYKIPKVEEGRIVETALLGANSLLFSKLLPLKQAAQGNKEKIKSNARNIGEAGKKARSNASSIASNARRSKAAGDAARAAKKVAEKANYEALYAASKASAAKNVGSSALKTATKAFSAVASITSLLGTFATMAAMAKMQQQIINLKNVTEFNRKIIEQNKLKANQAISNTTKNKADIDSINMRMLIYDKQIKAQNQKIEDNHKIIQANQQKLTILEAKYEQWTRNIDKRIEAVNSKTQQLKQKIESQINATNKKVESVNSKTQQLGKRVIQSDIRMTGLITGQKGLSDALETAKLPEIIKDLEKVVNQKINENVRIRRLGDQVQTFELANKGLKGGQVNLKSSLDGINTKLEQGLIPRQRLGEGDITKLKTNQDEFKFEQAKLRTEITDIKRTNLDQVNNQQVAQINSKLDKINNNVSQLPNPLTIALAVGSLDIFRQILNKRNPISPCQAPVLVPPVAAQVRANGLATAGFRVASLAQGTAIQNTVNVTKGIISHPTFGLEAMQGYAQTAWKATGGDKALQMVNTVILLSNALYLGSNIGETIGDVSSLILSSLGIKNFEGQSIDVNEAIGNSIQNWIISKIGQANFSELENKINKSNRTVKGMANLYSGVRSMIASTQDIAEETGIDVAKIGNALRDSSAVESHRYTALKTKAIWFAACRCLR